MNVMLAYHGHSRLIDEPSSRSRVLGLVPNAARSPVAFDGALKQPLRFREAISALHDVVVSDLRFQPRDRTAYHAWQREQVQKQLTIQARIYHQLKAEADRRRAELPANFEETFEAARRRYWTARNRYTAMLAVTAPLLWRQVVPCDPVVTVADDVVFFEAFSKDESSYGCLTADREDAFHAASDMQTGTTNVDYSQGLFDSLQMLRSYRETRLKVDPDGFAVSTGEDEYREEKIDLPPGWLQGFLQTQAAMTLPMRRVSLTRDVVYSLCAFLKRNKARTSPRAVRFELVPGKPVQITLEPWNKTLVAHGTRYDGPETAPVRVWGRNRLLVLERLLPIAESFDVYLLGTGLPSFWVARLGEMRFVLGLSGWTTNDWTRSSAIDLLGPPAAPSADAIDVVSARLQQSGAKTLEALAGETLLPLDVTAAACNHLARVGQVIYDLPSRCYRWRQVLDRAVGEADRGGDHPELVGCQRILERGTVKLDGTRSQWQQPDGTLQVSGKSDGCAIQLTLDAEGRIRDGSCVCRYYQAGQLRKGPCRHLLAARWAVMNGTEDRGGWFNRLRQWSN